MRSRGQTAFSQPKRVGAVTASPAPCTRTNPPDRNPEAARTRIPPGKKRERLAGLPAFVSQPVSQTQKTLSRAEPPRWTHCSAPEKSAPLAEARRRQRPLHKESAVMSWSL